MNRKQQRRGKGMVIYTQIVTSATTGDLYWFECPEKFSLEKDGLPPDATLHGPFKTQAEVKASQHLILFGPQCKVIEGGKWDPAWDKPQ
jgi:hypothetical protein